MEIQSAAALNRNAFTVNEGQCLFDIAIQTCGSVEPVFALAELNQISITDSLTAGQQVRLPDIDRQDVAGYFISGNIVPATGTTI